MTWIDWVNVMADWIRFPTGKVCGFDEDICRPFEKYVFWLDTVDIKGESNENGWYVDDPLEQASTVVVVVAPVVSADVTAKHGRWMMAYKKSSSYL